jgi:UDP-N-acetylglucosamine 4,6-dehydratase
MMYKNKTFLITGGTGSLGQALIKRLLSYDAKVIIYSRDEGKQAQIFNNNPNVVKVIGDIRDYSKLDMTLKTKKVDFIIHAAALKRIDDMEFYPDECIKTNINGSDNVAKAAISNGIQKCILVSTDKACQPINVYGSTKFIAERLFTNYDYNSDYTTFASVRYGNVIASRGSFIPLFMDKLNNEELINVTSTEMTRFLFTLEDAVDAVLGAFEHSKGGEVFVPQIDSYTLPTCIKALEEITGKDAKTGIIGLRPGEKLHEDMLAETELPFTFKVPGINLLQIRPQYTTKYHQSSFNKYEGPHFNSKLWVKNDIKEVVELIKRGLGE